MPLDPDRIHALVRAATAKANAAERAAFLDEACAGDADLRRQVEALLHTPDGLEIQPDKSTTVVERTGEPAPPIDAGPAALPAGEVPGTSVGPYHLLERIGEGGMGVVYRAEQAAPVRRQVALKVIKPGMDSAQVIARFKAERQALALMDHLHIARVLDAGTTASGRPYFAMELVEGVPITRYADEMHLSLRQRLELFLPVCRAVQHAHQKGIIHRDLKPSNILVSLQDGQPVPKVIDFGLAKALHQRLTDHSLHTGLGMVMGTLEYMAPEQAGVSAMDIDTRADIYSLGAVLYELLTGSPPLDRGRLRGASLIEVLRRIREDEPPPPSARLGQAPAALAALAAARRTEPRRLARLVRGELDWIVMKALEKDRSRRYDTASGLARDLERHLADEPVTAGPPSAGYQLRKFARKHRRALFTAAAFALLLVVGAAVSGWLALQAVRERDRAVDAEQRAVRERDRAVDAEQRAVGLAEVARTEAATAKAMNDFLQFDLLLPADPAIQPVSDVTLRAVLDRAARKIAGRFPQQPLVEAEIRQVIGLAYNSLGNQPEARRHLERCYELRQRELGDEHDATRMAMNNLAGVYQAQGEYSLAERLYVPVLAINQRRLGPEHPDTLAVMNNLSFLYQVQGKYAEAEQMAGQTLEIVRRVEGPEHPHTVVTMNNLATIYRDQGKHAQAEPLLVQALDAVRRTKGPNDYFTLATMHNLANCYRAQGKVAQAEPLALQTLEGKRRLLGPEHPFTLATMGVLGRIYVDQGKYAQAEPLLVEAWETGRRKQGPEHPDTLMAQTDVALLYQAQGQLTKAEPLFATALEAARRVLGANHPHTLMAMGNLALLYQAQGKYAEAQPLLVQVLEGRRHLPGTDRPEVASALAALGLNRLRRKQYAEAEPLLHECLTIYERQRPDDWWRFNVQSRLGASLLGQQKHAAAEPLLVAGYEGLEKREAKIPPASKICLTEALERLVELYQATGQKDRAEAWRKKREALPPPKPAAKP
jgi:non-specific serine/threonine protein kinase/serine/threonine-protein kinase